MKHWQLFILLFFIPILSDIGLIISLFLSYIPEKIFTLIYAVIAATLLLQFSWFYSMGYYLNQRAPHQLKQNINKLRFYLLLPILYMIILAIFFRYIFRHPETDGPAGGLWTPLLIVPMHLFSMYCIFCAIYFVAKALRTVETKREVGFIDFVGEFAMVLVSLVGVWFLQPRINKIFNCEPGEEEDPYAPRYSFFN